ncbi:MAG TPA: hypothetical protein VES00_09270 [Burkholderiaceae bacterium]|jgi:hypothetical protein|nr:hypothetical protein [Burkholderiaceae bacterium]
MSARKMLAVYLLATRGVLGVATRKTPGAPPVGDLVGDAFVARTPTDIGVAVPAELLDVKEVDYADEVVVQPATHGLDDNNAIVALAGQISAVSGTTAQVSLTLSVAAAADKAVLVVIDAGAGQAALRFNAKTTASNPVDVAVNGVSPGSHVVLASVDGYAPFLDTVTFA